MVKSQIMSTYHIVVIGCQMNKADGERLAAYLESLGLGAVDKSDEADLVALVTCGVRQRAEDRIYGLVNQLKLDNPHGKIILTGCLSDRPDVQKRLRSKVDLFFNIKDLPFLADKLKTFVIARTPS
jgi:tRNA-2-methylthio-N6-dimethylallyladenosine synthase